MIETALELITSPTTLIYVSIPLVSAMIGWGTNWLAIKMTFYPLEFRGLRPIFGWQGIIPRNSDRIARKTAELITSHLISVEEVIARVEPARVAQELAPVYDEITDEIVEKVISAQSPVLWELLPLLAREQVAARVREAIPELVERIMGDGGKNLAQVFDLQDLVLRNLTGANKAMLNEIFLRCGAPEFRFIVCCGLYFGFGLGLIQCLLWYLFQAWWLLPLCGVVVGYVTNWLALKMIFRPRLPRRFVLFTYQGLFLKRQDAVSQEYGRLLANRIIIPSKIVDTLVLGDRAGGFIDIVHREVRRITDEKAGLVKGVVLLAMGTGQYIEMKQQVTNKLLELISRHTHRVEDYWRASMDLERMVYQRLGSLPAPKFEEVLHTCFEQDEWMLIAVGAALGLMAGLLQAAAVTWL